MRVRDISFVIRSCEVFVKKNKNKQKTTSHYRFTLDALQLRFTSEMQWMRARCTKQTSLIVFLALEIENHRSFTINQITRLAAQGRDMLGVGI